MMSWSWRAGIQAVADLLWPQACLLCERPAPGESLEHGFCSVCASTILHDPGPSCTRCASTVGAHVDTTTGCRECAGRDLAFDSAQRLGRYDGALRDVILLCKRRRGEMLAEAAGRLWAARYRDRLLAHQPDRIVPVPLHFLRRWQRGYNQAEALARGLSQGLGVPLNSWSLRRVRRTPLQTLMTPAARRSNVQDAFRVRLPGVQAMRVLLVDDVLTTGATADAAARALRQAGAAQVHVAVLAHR